MVAEYRERLIVLLSRAAALQHTSNILRQESSKAISQIRQSGDHLFITLLRNPQEHRNRVLSTQTP